MPRTDETPPTLYVLRELWRRYSGHGVVQRVILELQHIRRFLGDVEPLRKVIQKCWYAEAECHLVALELLRAELASEMFRAGVVTDAKIRPLPAFTPPSRYDLGALREHEDPAIRSLVAELTHARVFLLRMDGLRITILRCWRAETDCDLVALEKFRELLEVEKARAGVNPTAAPARREEIGLTTRIPLDFDGQSQISN